MQVYKEDQTGYAFRHSPTEVLDRRQQPIDRDLAKIFTETTCVRLSCIGLQGKEDDSSLLQNFPKEDYDAVITVHIAKCQPEPHSAFPRQAVIVAEMVGSCIKQPASRISTPAVTMSTIDQTGVTAKPKSIRQGEHEEAPCKDHHVRGDFPDQECYIVVQVGTLRILLHVVPLNINGRDFWKDV